jgi:hypothetical protein
MKRRYERTVRGGWVEVLTPKTSEDVEEIERRTLRGEVDASASFGDRRDEVNEGRGDEDDEEDTGAEVAVRPLRISSPSPNGCRP